MKKLIRSTLQATSAMLAGLLIFFGQSAFAAPQAAVVSPTTITSGDTVNVTMFCTVAGNVIDAAYINVTGGSSSPATSFTSHTCVASDVTTGFVVPLTVTIIGTNTSTTANITYRETGATAGGSPGTSPASNTFTVNPTAGSSTDTAIESTGFTTALDGSNPITNNAWLKHSYTIKNTGATTFSMSSPDHVSLDGGYWFDNNEAQIISSGGATCTQSGYGYSCTGITIAPGASIEISFKTFYQQCKSSESTVGSMYNQEMGSPGFVGGNYDLTSSTFSKHSFDFKYIGCDFSSGATEPVKSSSSSNSSAVKVPSTGYSPLVTSLMIVTAGAALAGGSVLAYNKLKK